MIECISCSTFWPSKDAFTLHFKMAHLRAAEDFECQTCQKKFIRRRNLKAHKITAQHFVIDDIILPKTKLFECSWCDFQSDIITAVQSHVTQRHPQIKNPFRVASQYLTHSFNIFTELPKFVCPFEKCKTKTYSKDTMRSHFFHVHKSPETFAKFLESSFTICMYCKRNIRNPSFKLHSEWCRNISRS